MNPLGLHPRDESLEPCWQKAGILNGSGTKQTVHLHNPGLSNTEGPVLSLQYAMNIVKGQLRRLIVPSLSPLPWSSAARVVAGYFIVGVGDDWSRGAWRSIDITSKVELPKTIHMGLSGV